MITRLTKIQLIIFAVITLIGGAFVGGRYAQIDRLVVDRSFPVTVQLADSGGLFEGAQVTYRGIGIGRVGKMTFKDQGVQARLDIEDSAPRIPADIDAVVANKSAVGEQFIDLRPRSNTAPYLKAGAHIGVENTQIPIQTTQLLVDVNSLVKSVDTGSLKTVVNELGTALAGTGDDLGRIIDTSTAFIQTADDNIDSTRALINDSKTVLQTQIDKQGELATFSKNLALLSDTLVSSDADLRRLLDDGPGAAKEVRAVVDENSRNLGTTINNLITANRPMYENTQAVRALFILFPYLLEGAPSTLIQDDKGTPNDTTDDTWDVAFGLVAGLPVPGVADNMNPVVCSQGYRGDPSHLDGVGRRTADKLAPREFDLTADCTAQKLVPRNPSKTTVDHNRAAAAGYDLATDTTTDVVEPTASAPLAFGKDSWQWLFLGPAVTK